MFVFCLIASLLMPLGMIILGARWRKKPPVNRNGMSGYRTKWSQKSKHTWRFAHEMAGKIWMILGIIAAIISVVLFVLIRNTSDDVKGLVLMLVVILQALLMFYPYIPVEKALKENFNEFGRLKKEK
ncbi:MAG: SdpI family protein [Lachnospiraceae bacterium]|nr:SdpI family protein [Lachnospiraceae bacterium]